MSMFKPSILTLAIATAGLASFASVAAQEDTVKNDDVEFTFLPKKVEEISPQNAWFDGIFARFEKIILKNIIKEKLRKHLP